MPAPTDVRGDLRRIRQVCVRLRAPRDSEPLHKATSSSASRRGFLRTAVWAACVPLTGGWGLVRRRGVGVGFDPGPFVAAPRDAEETYPTVSQGCAALHPGLFSCSPYGRRANHPNLRLCEPPRARVDRRQNYGICCKFAVDDCRSGLV